MIGKTPAELGWEVPELTALRQARKPIAGINIAGFHRHDGSPMILRCFARPFDDEHGQFAGYRGTVTDVTDSEQLRELVKVINDNVGHRVGEEFLKTLLVDASRALHASAAYIGRFDWQSRQAEAAYLYEDGAFRGPEWFSMDGSPIEAIAAGETTIVTSGARERYPAAPLINRQHGESYAGTPLRDEFGQVFGLLALVGRRPFEDAERVKAVLQLFAGRVAAEMARATAQTAAEQSRQEMSRVLAALDLSRDHICVLDEIGRILYANRTACESAGLPPEIADFKGLRWRDFQPDAEYHAQLAERQAALCQDGFWQGEVDWVRPVDGVVLAWELRQTLLPSRASVVVATDISERRRIEAEWHHQQQLRAQANKMEALGQLAGGVAHDFNNLLGAILGFAQLITQDHPPESDTGRFAERIVRAGQRGRSLIEQILTFSRRNVIEPVTLELTEIVEETRDLLRPTLPSTTRLVVSGEAGALVFVDRGQMSQVLINLGVNASDALLGEAGLVEIRLGATDRSAPAVARLPLAEGRPTPASVEAWEDADGTGWIVTGGIGRGPTVSITVSDTGAGMPAAVRPHIFEPFFTTKDKSRGTGLGLAVIHTIVIEHGGAIVVRTANGCGTSFEVILPLAEAQAAVAAPSPPALLQAQRSGRVLLVDDDPDFLAMAGATLQRLGHRVRSLGDPIEALQTLRNEPGAWAILVTDQTMPQLKGGELLIAAKMLAPRLHCIVCTGSGRVLDLAEAAGAVATFSKPLDLDAFADTIGKLLEETFETSRRALI